MYCTFQLAIMIGILDKGRVRGVSLPRAYLPSSNVVNLYLVGSSAILLLYSS